MEESPPVCICEAYSASKLARASCGIYVPAPRGTGATGGTRGTIECFLRLPLFFLQSKFFVIVISPFPSLACPPRDQRRSVRGLDQCVDHHVVSVLPGIAFSLHLIESTQQYGVSEVLLSSFMASFIFSIIGAQPLCIAGVTGL